MFPIRPALAALALFAALPASAQDFGGVRLGGQSALLGALDSRAPGCPLSRTNVLVGTNRVLAPGAQQQQTLASEQGGCRPLVSTQVVAGVNLAAGSGSGAGQSLSASLPRGLIATTSVARGVNLATGHRALAAQQILGQTDR